MENKTLKDELGFLRRKKLIRNALPGLGLEKTTGEGNSRGGQVNSATYF
jgi:hypothetical protein